MVQGEVRRGVRRYNLRYLFHVSLADLERWVKVDSKTVVGEHKLDRTIHKKPGLSDCWLRRLGGGGGYNGEACAFVG